MKRACFSFFDLLSRVQGKILLVCVFVICFIVKRFVLPF